MQMKYCPGCGREVRAGANFCGKCGHGVSSASQQEFPSEHTTVDIGKGHQEKEISTEKKKKHRKPVMTLLLVLLIVIAVIYFSPFENLKIPFVFKPAPETGMSNSGENNSANGDYSPAQINVAHRNGKSPSPGPGSDEIDDEKLSPDKINQATENIEQALLSGDQTRIREIMTDNALTLYGNNLTGISREALVMFGEAFKSREIKTFSSMYTEYSIKLDGQDFTVSVARQKDGSWKIMRF